MKRNLLLAAGLAAAAFAAPASAQLSTSGLYVGASSGQSHFENVCSGVAECDDRDTNGSLFAGFQFSRYVALEAAWRFFGHAKIADASVKANAVEADAVLTLPMYKGFSLLGRVGVFHATMKGTTNSENKNGVTFGWGGQYDFDRWAARLEFQRHPKLGGGDFGAETDIDSLSLGVLIRFK
jgi:OOP family OmpA-OmpF porin